MRFSGLWLCFFLVCISVIGIAQESNSKPKTKKHKKKKEKKPPHKGSVYFIGFPVASVDPSFGLRYGLAASTSVYAGDPSTTNISSNSSSINFTSKKQLLIVSKSTIFTEKNKFKIDLDWQYLNSSQITYGLGTGPYSNKLASNGFQLDDFGSFSRPVAEEDKLSFHLIRLHQVVVYNVGKNFFLGPGYHLDYLFNIEDNLLDIDTVPPALTSYYAYNEKYHFKQNKSILSSLSANFIYDTRDNVNSPYNGRYVNFRFNYNPKWLGSSQNSTSLWLEYRDYFKIESQKSILAFWTFANLTPGGALPYMNMPSTGNDQYANSGRGYTQGRFRGQNFMYAELEFRQKFISLKTIPEFLGVNFFVNATTASNKDADIYLFKYVDPAVGAGLRMMLSKNSRMTLNLDYAVGRYGSHGVYVGVNEAF